MGNNNSLSTKNTAFLGLFLAFALILGYVEALIPIPIGIPGIKLGLPNFAVLLLIYLYGNKEAFIINILRILLSGFLFGNMFSIVYSLSGGIISFLIMVLLKRTGSFSMTGVSVAGGFAHNMGQLLTAGLVLKTTSVIYYLPALAIGGCITGAAIGGLAVACTPTIKRGFFDKL